MSKFRDLVRRADAARDQGNYRDAATLYGRAVEIRPKAGAMHIQCGHMHKELGDLDTAAVHYRPAKELRPTDPDLAFQLGIFYKLRGLHRAAELAIEEALRLKPGWIEPARELDAMNRSHHEIASREIASIRQILDALEDAIGKMTLDLAPNELARVLARKLAFNGDEGLGGLDRANGL